MIDQTKYMTLNRAAREIRQATEHPEFSVNDLRYFMSAHNERTELSDGVPYVSVSYVIKLAYKTGKAGF